MCCDVPLRSLTPAASRAGNGEGEGSFEVYCPATDYRIQSSVTECEDVSYVTSPYVPACLRECHWPPNTDNASRSAEAAAGSSNIRDDLDETITIDQLTVLIGEWIPFGSNQVVALNDRLGSGERCQVRPAPPRPPRAPTLGQAAGGSDGRDEAVLL